MNSFQLNKNDYRVYPIGSVAARCGMFSRSEICYSDTNRIRQG